MLNSVTIILASRKHTSISVLIALMFISGILSRELAVLRHITYLRGQTPSTFDISIFECENAYLNKYIKIPPINLIENSRRNFKKSLILKWNYINEYTLHCTL